MFRGRASKQIRERNPDLHYRTKNSSETAIEMVPLTPSRVIGCRYELKYHITESQTAGIVKYIKSFVHLDKYCRLRRSTYYPIVSLYLDSEGLDLCRESLVGLKNRFKLRIRSYTDDLDYPRFLEIKRRMNNIIIKHREAVMDLDIPTLLAGRSIPLRSDSAKVETLNQFQLYLDSIRARPVVLIRYMRQAYEDNFHNRLRITFDRELVYKITNLPEVKLGGVGWRQNSYTIGGVVLEIKFTGHYPIWLTRMVRKFDLQRTSISKYVSSVKESCLLKFCAPQLGHIRYG